MPTVSDQPELSDTDRRELAELVDGATALQPHAVARLVSVFQDRRATAAGRRAEAMRLLDERGAPVAPVIGVTGTPGSGKSSLLGRIAVDMVTRDEDRSVAVVAIDPSSQISGGSLLGDRTRLRTRKGDHRLFFRSEASEAELGGLAPSTFQVTRLLVRLYDVVFVETVGVGQSEADVRSVAEEVFLVIAPLGGDEVQYLKAGIIEVPNSFIINKSDEPASNVSYHQLKASLWLARPFDADKVAIYRTSAKTGQGLETLEQVFTEIVKGGGPDAAAIASRDAHFFERWAQQEWGKAGVRHLRTLGDGTVSYLESAGGFDVAQASFAESFISSLRN